MNPARQSTPVPGRATRRPFTVVVGTACAADGGAAALEVLRPTIRRCAHAVLVTTPRPLDGTHTSDTTDTAARGVTVVVQPCGIDRKPEGAARWLGSIDTAADVRALCRWLERGDWDAPLSVRWDARAHVSSRN